MCHVHPGEENKVLLRRCCPCACPSCSAVGSSKRVTISFSRHYLVTKPFTGAINCLKSWCRHRSSSYQHIWQWHGTFEDCQSVQTLGLGSVFDLYCPASAVPWPGMHGHCLATRHNWCRISHMHCIAFDRVSLGHHRAGRIKGPRKAPNMLICSSS